MTSFSLDYNRVVADARNRMILLNIVRAAYREPTYYTALSQIEGSLNLQASVSGAVADLAGGGDTSVSPTINGSIANAPTFTVVPLSSDEFSKGMLTPIDTDTIRLLLSQGWRSEMLAPLIVQKIQCGYDNKVFAEIENQPSKFDDRFGFATLAQIQLVESQAEAAVPYHFSVAPDRALSIVTGGALDKFDIVQDDKPGAMGETALTVAPKQGLTLSAILPESIASLCRSALSQNGMPGVAPAAMRPIAGATLPPPDSATFANLSFTMKSAAGPTAAGATRADDKSFSTLVFRSPDEIVYYLGELLREEIRTGKRLAQIPGDARGTNRSDAPLILFEVRRNAPGPAAVEVQHHGAKWSIPLTDPAKADSDRERTLEVVALLNELIASQTSASEFSRTPSTVRVR